MAADPYGENDTLPVAEARRKAQMEALQGEADPLGNALSSAATGGSGSGSMPPNPAAESSPTSGGGGAQQQATAPAFQPAAQMPSIGGGVNIANATPAHAPAITDEVTALLRQRLQQLSNPLDVTSDPIYQNQIKAFGVQAERDKDRERAQLAQRMAARGTISGGGLDTGIRGLNEQQSQRGQAYAANLAGERLVQREAQLNQAISMARAVGQDDVAMQLENEKLKLAAEALQLQQSLGMADIGLRANLGQQQVDLGYGNLGLGYAGLQNSMNRDSILALLGGG